jgi:hypothetical protein
MRCDEADALIDALAEEALSPAERVPLDAHVAGCARCSAALAASLALSATLSALPLVHPSPAADARALAAVAEERAWAAWRARMRRRVLVFGSAAALVACVGVVFVVTPAASFLLERAPNLARVGSGWLRWRAAPALLEALPTMLTALGIVAAVAVAERSFRATRSARAPR